MDRNGVYGGKELICVATLRPGDLMERAAQVIYSATDIYHHHNLFHNNRRGRK